FGGGESNAYVAPAPDAHWEWDGVQWTQGPLGPPVRRNASLVHDPIRNRTLLYGGLATCAAFSCPTFADTWEFDGTNWAQRLVVGPPARHSAMATFDATRNRTVLTGGIGGCVPACTLNHDDTYEWDGTQWTRNFAATPRLQSAGIAYDLANARTVVFGGITLVPFYTSWNSAETYGFDGTQWSVLAPSVMPPARNADALCFDEARGESVWFGTTEATNPGIAGTFTFRGTSWQQLAPPVSPPPRSYHAMSYDRTRQRVVLFGGSPTSGNFLRDTWEWDGALWTQVATPLSPPGQYQHQLAFDSVRNVTVLYPGAFGGNVLHEYDGLTWTPRPTPVSPPYRFGTAMCFDERRGKTVLFGGIQQFAYQDCWEWDGTTWTQDLSTARPPARTSARMVYDSVRGRCVLFGGYTSGNVMLQDTWEYDGSAWVVRSTSSTPRARSAHGMAFDRARGRTVMVGGYPGAGNFGHLHDTWELVTECDRAGPGELSGGGLPLSCTTPPRIGTTFCLGYSNPSPNAAGLSFLLLSPGSCHGSTLVISPPTGCAASFLYGVPTEVYAQIGGPATFCFAVPNNPVFLGAALCFQGSSFETTGCFRATDGVQVVVQ
ncbi:MAG: kelch repeat-containing protein, partial [Planctomycetota bacterium]